MQGVMAEEALHSFEVELGLSLPRQRPIARRPRISARRCKPREKQTN